MTIDDALDELMQLRDALPGETQLCVIDSGTREFSFAAVVLPIKPEEATPHGRN